MRKFLAATAMFTTIGIAAGVGAFGGIAIAQSAAAPKHVHVYSWMCAGDTCVLVVELVDSDTFNNWCYPIDDQGLCTVPVTLKMDDGSGFSGELKRVEDGGAKADIRVPYSPRLSITANASVAGNGFLTKNN